MSNRYAFALALLIVCATLTLPAVQVLAQNAYPPTMLPQVASPMATEAYTDSVATNHTFGGPNANSNQMLWQQYQTLQIGDTHSGYQSDGNCQACSHSGVSSYDRCGCKTELFPWIDGPGTCDRWCVGPKWAVDAGALMMFREDANWDLVSGGAAGDLVEQFDHGPGARLFVTGYSDSGYGLQVGYEGINDWDAIFLNGAQEFDYESSLNSVEINFLPSHASLWKWLAGVRYIEISDNLIDNTLEDTFIKNRLFGFQLGAQRDAWQFGNRVTFQTHANAGVYCNKLRREDIGAALTSRDFTEAAFAGEAGFTAALRLNHCTALRAGYEVLAVDGIGTALEASPGVQTPSQTLVYHGLQFGIEYRR